MRTLFIENTPGSTSAQYTLSRHYDRLLGIKAHIFSRAHQAQRKALKNFARLPIYQRILAALFVAFFAISIILVLAYNERIFSFLAPYAAKWRVMPGGWLILWALTFLTAFPPLIGYSTTITIAGFVYGFPNGWFIVATATICGSLASFIASRTVLSNYVNRVVGRDHRFQALYSALEHDGLKILCMIRLCPLPYSISNAAIATFPTVRPISFTLATAIASPKLLIHIFIGSRMANLAELGKNHQTDIKTRLLNYFSIIAGLVVGATVGWVIYQRILARTLEINLHECDGDSFYTSSNSLLDTEQQHHHSPEDTNIESLMSDEEGDLLDRTGDNDTYFPFYQDEETNGQVLKDTNQGKISTR